MDKNQNNYISPEMEIVNIEVEQAILSASIENIGDTLEEIDW